MFINFIICSHTSHGLLKKNTKLYFLDMAPYICMCSFCSCYLSHTITLLSEIAHALFYHVAHFTYLKRPPNEFFIWFYRFPFYTHYLSQTLHAHDHFWHVPISVIFSYIICPTHYIACQRNSITIFIICRKYYMAWRSISYHKHTVKNVNIMFSLWIIWACIRNSGKK